MWFLILINSITVLLSLVVFLTNYVSNHVSIYFIVNEIVHLNNVSETSDVHGLRLY
jgi:hypothetical protein